MPDTSPVGIQNGGVSDSLAADVTDDSCRLEFIEIVPLTTDTTQCDSGHWSDDVKQHLSVVKQEPPDVCVNIPISLFNIR